MKYKPEIISKECFGLGHYACNFSSSPEGEIFIPVPDLKGSYYALTSKDNGSSFKKEKIPNVFKDVGFKKLANGDYIAFEFANCAFRAVYNPDISTFPFCLAVYRAKSMEDILSGNVETSFSLVDIPHLAAGWGDSNNRHSGCVSGWRQLSNGDIYLTMYGQFTDDTTLCPYFEKEGGYKFYLYRTWALVSHDNGASFEFAGTIADCQTYPIKDVNAEGYCEADIEEVEKGHLVCVLRTGGHEVYSPLYRTNSYDFGKTWEKPEIICDWGVLPRLLKLGDGTLLCASGHIHTMLLFSYDNGETWDEAFIVDPCDGKWDKSPSGYSSVFECAPGIISLVYDDPKEGIAAGWEAGKVRQVYNVKIKLSK